LTIEALDLGCDSVQTERGEREEIEGGAQTTCDTLPPHLRKMIMMHKFLAVAVAAWIALLAGCNTLHGFGQDMQVGGEKIQDKAKK